MKYAYQLYNKVTKTYSDLIFRFEDFGTYSKQLHDFCILYPDKAKEQFHAALVLIRLDQLVEVDEVGLVRFGGAGGGVELGFELDHEMGRGVLGDADASLGSEDVGIDDLSFSRH